MKNIAKSGELLASSLLSRLPPVRGRYSENAALDKITWFQVGGSAEIMFRPVDADDLSQFLKNKPAGLPVTVIGVGSNILVRDGGVPGVVIRLGREFATIKRHGDRLEAGAGALDVNVAMLAQQESVSGLEFLSGIPGTVGGALRMNAGAYGREMKDVLIEAQAVDPAGNLHILSNADMQFAYRKCAIPRDWIFTGATMRVTPDDGEAIAERMQTIKQQREATQPVRSKTGGSTFKNPDGHRAWELIDKAGCRGLTMGGAQISEKHCNFLINTGGATATELENLGEEVRARVLKQSGIALHWEIERIGESSSRVAAPPRIEG